jgi:hypothetical protein
LKDYVRLWAEGLSERDSRRLDEGLLRRDSKRLTVPVNAIGEREKHFGSGSEFARVQVSIYPADGFGVEDVVAERNELEGLSVGWPEPVIFGLLDVLILADSGPFYKVRVVLEKVWYHEVDSSQGAFREAGRDAGRKIIQSIEHRPHDGSEYEMT